MSQHMRVQSISNIDILRIHFSSCIYGIWVIFKNFAKLLWFRKNPNSLQLRDNPPACLVDSSIGQHKYIKLKGVKFHFVEAGPKDQPLLLFLHGFPDCWLTWRYQIPVFSKHFRVLALDLKGFGDSDKPHWRSSYKIEVIIEELKQLIFSLGVQKCVVVGHDLGALIGWYLVHLEPSIVSKFFAVSCPHPNIYWKSLMNIKKIKWLNFVQVPYLPEIDALKEDMKLISDYHKHLPNDDVYLEAYKYTFSRQEDWTGPLNYYRNLLCNKINENCESVLPTVILITGSGDQLFKLEGLVKSTEYCEKFHMKMVDNAEHFPHQECPEMFNNILFKYLLNPQKMKKQDSQPKRLVQGILGAVSNTVKYSNLVVESVQERASGVVGNLSSVGLLPFHYLSQSDP